MGGGVGLGAVFFGGLWWTVRGCTSYKQPALWFFGSLLLRMGITLAGFYVVSNHHGSGCYCVFSDLWWRAPWWGG